MANWQVISLDTTTPQLRAPGTGDGYSFNSGATQLGVWTTTGLGIGTASPSTKLQVIGNTKVGTGAASNSATFMVNNLNASATGIQLFQDGQESWIMGLPASSTALTWANSGSEKMRLDTVGNLGIGTSSPVAKLQSTGGVLASGAVAATVANAAVMDFSGGLTRFWATGSDTSTQGSMIFVTASSNASVYNERMRLDASGNLGLNVTPPAWGSNHKAISSAAVSASHLTATVNALSIGVNYYNDNTNFIYVTTGQNATRYSHQPNGEHRWFTAPSGTAGNTISFTQVMTLDASGNLGIGTTSPSGKLHVNGNFLRIDQSGANQVYFGNAGDLITGAPAGGAIRFDGTALRFASSSTQIAMFDSSGRLLVGGTSAVYASSNGAIEVQSANAASLNAGRFAANTGGPTLTLLKSRNATVGGNTIVVDGDTLGDVSFVGANGTGYDEAARIRASVDGTPGASGDMPGRLTFWTSADGSASPTERARITSGGLLLVKRTTALDSGQIGLDFDGINNNGIAINDSVSANGSGFIKFLTGGTVRGSVTNNANTGVLYNTTSDERLKKNIADADEFGDVIDAIKVRKFDWKENDSHTRAGFVAQELVTVAPEAVYQPNNEEDMMGVDYSKLVPMLVKEIQSLRARVAQLEAK